MSPLAARNLARRVPLRVVLLALVFAGWLLAELVNLHGIASSPGYLYATSLLLGIGLYGSTYGVDLAAAREHRRIIVTAVTVGVLVKAGLIIGVLYLITRDPLFIVLGVAVAQIDPLSVATIMRDERMSPRVKAILASWASFDDPITVILAVYASAVATGSFGLGRSTAQEHGIGAGVAGYGIDLLLNLALAAAAYLAWRTLRGRPRLLAAVLGVLAAVAVWQFLMLAIAIAGLFVRPGVFEALIPRITNGALLASGVLLGLLLVNGVSLTYGLLLGAMAFAAQVVVGTVLSRGLPRPDRVHLALAQQNGITAIILALRLEVQFVGVVAIVAPAIVVTNAIYFATNWLSDRRARRRPPPD